MKAACIVNAITYSAMLWAAIYFTVRMFGSY